MKKGEEYSGTVETVLFPNRGVVHADGTAVIVKNTIAGQTVRFRISKKRNGRAEGRLLEVLQSSPEETQESGCSIYPDCGGCQYRTLPYAAQLKMKEEQVRWLLQPVAGESFSACFEGIHASPSADAYRNKMEYSFGDCEKGGLLNLGLHRRGSIYDVLCAADCRIVHEDFNRIVTAVLRFCREKSWPYMHKKTHEGYLRHLLVRRASGTGEILVDLVTGSNCPEGREREEEALARFAEMLTGLQLDGRITGILHTVNDSLADVVQSDRTDILYGREYFTETLLGLQFRITPFSFFQTNSAGAEVLYGLVREYLGDVSSCTVFDLYSGTGTIAQMLAAKAGRVVGVEIVEEAVQAAIENARANHLENCHFIAGDVLKVLDTIEEKPDVIVLDPPREGIHPKALPRILSYGVPKIVYISCKATSLARDLAEIQKAGYAVSRAACVDMFPATAHIETIVLLQKLNS